MKRQWWMTAGGAVLLTLTSSFAMAQDHKNDQGENHGQDKKHYRQFNDNQRQAAREYYKQHHDDTEFKRDNWNDDYEARIKPGYVLDPDMRRMSHPAPHELTRGLGPAPRGYHYVVIGGHVVLVDNEYRVHDAIHLELNF